MEKILVSACLLGDHCTYKGGDNKADYLERLNRFYDFVPFCPEVEGGLPTPRKPSEIRGNNVVHNDGTDVTKAFHLGAYKATAICSYLGIKLAIMKENSPSCGPHKIYDGSFTSRLKDGQGVTVAALRQMGVEVLNEEEGRALLERLEKEEQIKDEKTRIAVARQENAKKEEPLKQDPKPEKKAWKNKGFSYQGKTKPGTKRPFKGNDRGKGNRKPFKKKDDR